MKSLRTAIIVASAAVMASAAYDPVMSERAMYYSGASYCDKATLDSWTCGEPCTMH